MSSKLSRRDVLAAGTALGASALAGCMGANSSSSSATCETSAVEHGDGKVLQEVEAVADDDTVLLSITFLKGKQTTTDRLRVYDSSGELEYEIPTTKRRTYLQTIGRRPQHGRLQVVSLEKRGRTDEPTDELTVDFNCWISEDSGWAPKTTSDSTDS